MNPTNKNIWRFFLLLLLQVLVFKQLTLGSIGFNYVQIFIYPLFIFLLPINLGKSWLLVVAFVLGMAVDMFYDSPGIHAFASVFTAFVRPFVLYSMEPRGGYKVNSIPTTHEFGTNWFYRYVSVLMVVHLFAYFSVEAFQISQILGIILRTITSFFASMIMIILYVLIFNPRQ